MSSEGAVPALGGRLYHLSTWFDPETAGVVTILLGLFQVLLAVPLAYTHIGLPNLFILPVVLGVVIVTAGSFTVANVKNPNRQLLRGCAYSNVVSLLGTLLAFCLYCYSLSLVNHIDLCAGRIYGCPGAVLVDYSWSLNLLLILYDIGAVALHSLLSLTSIKALKTD